MPYLFFHIIHFFTFLHIPVFSACLSSPSPPSLLSFTVFSTFLSFLLISCSSFYSIAVFLLFSFSIHAVFLSPFFRSSFSSPLHLFPPFSVSLFPFLALLFVISARSLIRLWISFYSFATLSLHLFFFIRYSSTFFPLFFALRFTLATLSSSGPPCFSSPIACLSPFLLSRLLCLLISTLVSPLPC